MKRSWLLIGAMLACAALSFWSAHSIQVAPYGPAQIVLFASSSVIAGACAVKGVLTGRVDAGIAGGLVLLYLAGLFYLLFIF